MTIHIEHADTALPKCGGEFKVEDDFEDDSSPSDCIECVFFDDVQARWEEYVSQPVNFGEDTPATRIAERDAFFAGAFVMLKERIPF